MLNNQVYDKQGLSPEKMFKGSIGVLNVGEVKDVEILVSGPVAAYFSERRWHDSQETIKKSEGLLFKFKVKVNDELVRFVLSIGPSATVIKPIELRNAVVHGAEKILDCYKKSAA
ncbi:MAG: WYL domain-containing protein [Bdellovibrionaceae bacterium]|nr:WYL domain-containing protein [Pseudobdellovibrionaceae bacterium]